MMFKTFSQSFLPRHRRCFSNQREGAAAVEAAICIPIVIMLMLGTLEVCSGLYLSESLTVCAYEAARAGVRRRTTAEDVYDRAVEVLQSRNITLPVNESGELQGIVIEPSNFDDLEALDVIRVTITANTSGNSLYIFDSFFNRDVQTSVSMVREFDE